jgi:ketosteroid isomerase-like protein
MARLLGSVVVVGLTGLAFGSYSVKSDLEARYRQVTAAFQSKNIAAISNLLMPDYKAVSPSGQAIGRDQVIAGFKQQMSSVQDVKWRRTIVKLTVSGPNATAVVDGDLHAHLAPGRGPKTLEVVATTVDQWVKTSGGWKLKSSKLKTSKMLLDGKPAGMR